MLKPAESRKVLQELKVIHIISGIHVRCLRHPGEQRDNRIWVGEIAQDKLTGYRRTKPDSAAGGVDDLSDGVIVSELLLEDALADER